MIAHADIIRDAAKEEISELKEKGVHSIMLTGDNEKVAHWVAKQLDIDEVYAEVLPDDKANKVKEIQSKGDRKSTRLNSSHVANSYAAACWKKQSQHHRLPTASC